MSNDPLDVVFVTSDEAAALKRADTARKLATYLERMPIELRGMFENEFQHINRAELAAAQERIAQQAEQLEQAREVIDHAYDDLRYMAIGGSISRKMCKEWLSANAQPQEQSA